MTNVGKGKALDSFAQIKNAGDQNVFIEKGRFKLGELEPGETKTARFSLQVKKGYKGDNFPLKLAIIDEPLEEFAAEKLELPVAADDAAADRARGAQGRREAGGQGRACSPAPAPTRGARHACPRARCSPRWRAGSAMARVELEHGRFAFVHLGDARDARGAKPAAPKDLGYVAFRNPPEIDLSVDPAQGGVVADGERYTLSAVINDPHLLDVYVLVNDQKVFFKTRAAHRRAAKLKFTTDFALKEGNNLRHRGGARQRRLRQPQDAGHPPAARGGGAEDGRGCAPVSDRRTASNIERVGPSGLPSAFA